MLPAGSIVTIASAPSIASAALSAGRQPALRSVERLGRKVEGADVMSGLRQVRGHAAAHIAEPDETDASP
jgi:hypothetical protein